MATENGTEQSVKREPPPLSLFSKFAFGTGSASESIFYIAFNLFCFFYFVQVLGLAGGLAGIAASIALIFDALSDPVVGYLSDRWKPGRLGRRHPFMFIAAFPLGMAWMALFAPPDGLGQMGLFFWLLGFSSLARICQTIFYVPHIAMGSEMSRDYTDRTRIFSWHIIFLWVGGAAVHFFGLRYFFVSETGPDGEVINGMLIAENYPVYGVVWAFVMMAVILFSTIFTISRIPYLKQDLGSDAGAATVGGGNKALGSHLAQVWTESKEVLRNRNYLVIVFGLFVQALGAGAHETLITHLINYVWQLDPEQFSLMAFASMAGYIGGFVLAVPLHRKFGKVLVLVCSTLLMGFANFLPVLLLMIGLPIEPGGDRALWLVLGGGAFYYSGQSLMLATIVSVIGDIADEHELNTGRRREGVLYSSRTLFSKMSSSMGHLIAGIILTVIAFPLGKEVLPGTLDQVFLDRLALAYLILVPTPYVLAVFLYMRYGIDQKKHERILSQLEQRRNGQPVSAGT